MGAAWLLWREPQAGFVPVSCDQRLPPTRREVVSLSGRRHPNLEDAIVQEFVSVFVAVFVGGTVRMFHCECHARSVASKLARSLRLTTGGCRSVYQCDIEDLEPLVDALNKSLADIMVTSEYFSGASVATVWTVDVHDVHPPPVAGQSCSPSRRPSPSPHS